MPSGSIDGASDGHAHIFYPPAAGPGGGPASEPEVERSPAPHVSPPSPHPHVTSTAAADTPGPSYTSHHSPEYVHAISREIAGVMDAICSLAATQEAQDQRLAQCHSML